jgi:hypothetical protein
MNHQRQYKITQKIAHLKIVEVDANTYFSAVSPERDAAFYSSDTAGEEAKFYHLLVKY